MEETIQTEKRREKGQIKVERPTMDNKNDCSAKCKKTSLGDRPKIPINNHWTFVYMGLLIVTGYLGITMKDYFVSEEHIERYEIGIQNLKPEINLGWE